MPFGRVEAASALCGGRPRAAWAALLALGLACIAALALPERDPDAELLAQRRNFFGVLRVTERSGSYGKQHRLLNSGKFPEPPTHTRPYPWPLV